MFAQTLPLETILIEFGAIPLIFVLLIAVGRWLKRRQGVKLGIGYVLFSLALAIWLPHALTVTEVPWREMILKHLGAITLFLGTLVFLALLRRYFWEGWFERQHATKAPKFLSQLVALALVVIATLVIISSVYGKSIQGAVFGSTVVLGVLGFAMQDLLGNIIAGIALEIGKPFKPGDWLVFDGRHAEVIEVNWRSTRLRNNDAAYIDIPNKQIVGSTITNLTYPTREHALRLTVSFEHGVPPNLVKDCMARAALHAAGVLQKPAPKVFVKDFGESAIIYEIKFWLDDESRYNDIVDGIKTNIWYEAQRSGLRFPMPKRMVHLERGQADAKTARERARSSFRSQPFLQLLDATQAEALLQSARLQRFGRGERIIEQGEEGRSMFMLIDGEAAVLVRANAADTEVATLRAGDYFGEMSLLTGEPRSATVVARIDCELWEISKEIVAGLLQKSPALVEQLSDLLAKRRLENEGHLAHAQQSALLVEKHRAYQAGFLSKLTQFFEL